jgi:hypothetical protein
MWPTNPEHGMARANQAVMTCPERHLGDTGPGAGQHIIGTPRPALNARLVAKPAFRPRRAEVSHSSYQPGTGWARGEAVVGHWWEHAVIGGSRAALARPEAEWGTTCCVIGTHKAAFTDPHLRWAPSAPGDAALAPPCVG